MGLFDTKQKRGQKAESWSISTKNGLPVFFEKNGREWFDADKTWASQPVHIIYIPEWTPVLTRGSQLPQKAKD